MIDILLALLMFSVLVFDVQKKENIETAHPKESSNSWKGILAIAVLLHHISLRTDSVFFRYIGVPSVDGFFMISAYGATKKYLIDKKMYGIHLIRKKIPKTLIFICITLVISFVFYCIIGESPSFADLVYSFAGNKLLNWYFSAYLVLEMMLCISIIIVTDRTKRLIPVFTALSIAVFISLYVMGGVKTNCLESLPAYYFGMGLAFFDDYKTRQKTSIMDKVYKKILSVPIVILLIIELMSFVGANYVAWSTIIKMACLVILATATSLLIYRVCIVSRKGIVSKIGMLSGEMLAIQTISPVIMEKCSVTSPIVYLFGTVAIHALILMIVTPIYKKLAY